MTRLSPAAGMLAALAAAALLACAAVRARAGEAPARDGALKVFLDCPACDFDYLRTEIQFVNYMQDRKQAQVHVLVTTQPLGGGGTEYTLAFIGRGRFRGSDETVVYDSRPDDTADLVRRGLARRLKLGLARYLAATPFAGDLDLTFDAPSSSAPASHVDPWDSWVFTVNINTNVSGQQLTRADGLGLSGSVDRVTREWKTSLSPSFSYNESFYKVGDQTLTSVTRYAGFQGFQAAGLGEHWSAGLSGGVNTSTYNNVRLELTAAPMLEYDVFPYSQSTRRQLRLGYQAGVQRYVYLQRTIFGKDAETLGYETLSAALDVKEPWGSMNATLTGSNYLRAFRQNDASLSGSCSFRLFEGFSLQVSASAQAIHDQLSLPAMGATEEEILLQQSQLATQYDYYSSVGITYTFGSTYNNVVNPRFGS